MSTCSSCWLQVPSCPPNWRAACAQQVPVAATCTRPRDPHRSMRRQRREAKWRGRCVGRMTWRSALSLLSASRAARRLAGSTSASRALPLHLIPMQPPPRIALHHNKEESTQSVLKTKTIGDRPHHTFRIQQQIHFVRDPDRLLAALLCTRAGTRRLVRRASFRTQD